MGNPARYPPVVPTLDFRSDLQSAANDTPRACILFRALLEIRDDVGPVLSIVQMEEHLDARNDGLRIGQPLVERLLVPDHIGGFERVRIGIVGQRTGLAAIDAPMTRTDVVLVERM